MVFITIFVYVCLEDHTSGITCLSPLNTNHTADHFPKHAVNLSMDITPSKQSLVSVNLSNVEEPNLFDLKHVVITIMYCSVMTSPWTSFNILPCWHVEAQFLFQDFQKPTLLMQETITFT